MDKTLMEEMLAVGAHFGYNKTQRHPSTKEFVFTTKNKTDIVNLEATAEMLEKALEFITTQAKEEKIILFVGAKAESKDIVKATAESLNMPYVTNRWIGGTLTNWTEIKKRIELLISLKDKRERGELEKYTKKEQSDFSRQIEKMDRYFGGLVGMTKKPDAMFIVDVKKEINATKEAEVLGIPVVTLSNTDCDISNITYPVVANDASVASIQYFLDKVKNAFTKS